jgi:hypothetical protein
VATSNFAHNGMDYPGTFGDNRGLD